MHWGRNGDFRRQHRGPDHSCGQPEILGNFGIVHSLPRLAVRADLLAAPKRAGQSAAHPGFDPPDGGYRIRTCCQRRPGAGSRPPEGPARSWSIGTASAARDPDCRAGQCAGKRAIAVVGDGIRKPRARGSGEVRLRLKVARKGNLIGVALDRSSGFDVLDQHALAMLEQLASLPPLPEALDANEIQVVVPVNYKLKKTT